MTSPDYFHQIRISNSSFKASNFNLQMMEFKSHNLIINEYQQDILNHLLSLENQTTPNLSLIQQQPEINLKMRPLLLDFLMDVINKLNFSKSTFPSTVNLIDRYCSTRIVKKQHYQLLGLTCLWISCKNLDAKYKIPNLNDLSKMCCNCYDKKLFLEMENHLLKSLNWIITIPTFDGFIDLYLNLLQNFPKVKISNNMLNDLKILSIYICELIQFYPNIYFNYNTSLISLTSFLISCKILNLSVNINEFIYNLNSSIEIDKDFENFYDNKTNDFFTFSKISNLSKLLIKILKCPPPSLKLKYFNDSCKFINLMEKLINFTNFKNEPVTPKTYKLPPTPVSNNISPKYKSIIDNIDLTPGNKEDYLPSPNSPNFNIHPPLMLPNRKRSHESNEPKIDLKRSKSVPLIYKD
ncbi:G1/S-specific cyclin Cln3p [[Candida] jaroonii]|uniref:G1/S-specific cyclin Cln3p n=1 Tax=[Candida] jaroonii TaxID=467808 RepID=A0ACA9YDL1_9ASCO|nr:G1/S-specific cyclin Cln3p [[Candida] jaroonii]